MSDEVDKANELIELELGIALKEISSNAEVDIKGSGLCVVCYGVVDSIMYNGQAIVGRFCCDECRDEFDKVRK